MTIKRISIPKIPQNLTIEQVAPLLDKLRQAINEIQKESLKEIDGRNIKFGTITEQKIEPKLLIDVKARRYYIEPTNGTSIKNSAGTLTIRVVQVDGSGVTLLTAGPIKMFKPDGTLAGNGYTWTATAADINNSIIVTLKHEIELTEWDTITLVDITDGGDAVIAAVDADNGLVWTRAIDSGVWTPATTTTDLTATFYRLGVAIATRVVRVTLNTSNGTLTASLQSNTGEPTTHVITGSGTEALSVSFSHTASGASVIESTLTVQGADSGLSTFVANVYRRSSSAPATPAVNDGSYDFGNNTLIAPAGWFVTPPAGTDPLYVSTGSFSIVGQTGTDNTVIWTSPDILVQDGAVGGDGRSVHVAQIFLRKSTAPTKPIADDGSYDFTNNLLTAPSIAGGSADDWLTSVPAGTDPLYVCSGTFEIIGTTGTDNTVAWTTPQILASDGAVGGDGLSVHVANIFKRSPTSPPTPSVNDGSYDFGNNTLIAPAGWFVTPPAGTDPLYISTGSFSVVGTTGTDNTVTWTSPDLLAEEPLVGIPDFTPGLIGGLADFFFTLNQVVGGTPNDGEIRIQGELFQHPDGTSIPTNVLDFALHTPYEGTVTGKFYIMFSAIVAYTRFGGIINDWGDGSDTRFCIVTHDDANGWRARNNSGTYFAFTPINTDALIALCEKISTSGGIDSINILLGGVGKSVHVANVYKRSASAPATPAVDDGSYNFGTQTLTPPSGWAVTPPAGVDPLYVSTGSFAVIGSNRTDNTVIWTAPDLLVQDGAAGATGGDGNSVHVGQIFLRKSTAPTKPIADDGSYDFTNNLLTAPSIAGGSADDWLTSVPAGTDPLYVCSGTFEINGTTGTDNTVVWTTPAILASDGAVGDDGSSVHVANVYQRSSTVPATPSVNDGSYDFGNNTLIPPSGWAVTPPAGLVPLYVSTGSFSVIGQTGVDNTVVWTAPDLLVQDGLSSVVIDTRDWVVPDVNPMGAWYLGTGNLANTVMSSTTSGPFGEIPLVMDIRGDGGNPGWYAQWRHDHLYDKDKSYIYYVWVQRKVADTLTGLYLGFTTAGAGTEVVNTAGGAAQANPYFVANVGSALTVGKWYLAVGVIYPDGYLGADQGVAGIYDPADGVRVYNGNEYEWRGQQLTEVYLRIGYHDQTAPVMNTDDGFLYTRVVGFVRDGTEPSIEAVLNLAAQPGNSVHVAQIFLRKSTAPTKPIADDGSYDFTNNLLTAPSIAGGSADDWLTSVPAGTDPLYVCSGTFEINGTTGTDNTVVWTTPAILASDGAAGAPGDDAITGFVEPENGLGWTRAINQGAWTPSQTTTDLDVTFILGNVVVARIARRITLTTSNGTLAASTVAHKGGDLNTSRVTVSVSGAASTAITVQFDYSFGGDTGSAAATVSTVQSGDDADAVVLLTNKNVFDAGFGGAPRQAGIRVKSLGTLEEKKSTGYTQINTATDWVRPTDWAPGIYQAMVTKTGDAVSGSALNTWIDVTNNPEWYVSTSGASVTATLTLSIRRTGGSTLDSSVHVCTAEVIV